MAGHGKNGKRGRFSSYILVLFLLGLILVALISISPINFVFVVNASPANEDFTGWTESVGEGVLARLSQTALRCTFVGMTRDDDDVYLYDDKGVGNFEDFIIDFDFNMTSLANIGATIRLMGGVVVLTNTLGDIKSIATTATYACVIINSVSSSTVKYTVQLKQRDGGITNDVGTYQYSTATMYYFRFSRSGTDLVLWSYGSDANRCNNVSILETLSFSGASTAYQYSQVTTSVDNPTDGAFTMSGYVENLDLEVVIDVTAPFFSDVAFSQNVTNRATNFSCVVSDTDSYLSHAVFSWNATGSWVNRSAYAFPVGVNSSLYNRTEILPFAGLYLGFRFYANDTLGNMNVSVITAFSVVLEVTFLYNSTRGLLMVNGTDTVNGTVTTYLNNTLLRLSALVYNSSFCFANFTWFLNGTSESGSSLVNPYNLILVNKNYEVQTVFVVVPAEDHFYVYLFVLVAFAFGFIGLVVYRRKFERGFSY